MKKTNKSGRWCLEREDINIGDFFFEKNSNLRALITQYNEQGLRIYWSNGNHLFYNTDSYILINSWLDLNKNNIYISSIHG